MTFPGGQFPPDPLRDHFTRGARVLLDRAYKHPGAWQGTLLANPDARALRHSLSLGINPYGPDNASAQGGAGRRGGGLNARSRWMRAFVRCLYEQHLWWAQSQEAPGWRGERRLVALRTRSLMIDVGVAKAQLGVIPAGRAIRIRSVSPGRAAAERKPDRDRIYTDAGTGDRWSDPGLRDWA